MDLLARLFARRRAWVAAGVVIASLLAVAGLFRIRFDAAARGFFASDDPSYATLLEVFEDFGSDDLDVVLLVHGENVLGERGVDAQRELLRRARSSEGVRSAWGPPDVLRFEAGAFPRPLFPKSGSSQTRWDAARAEALAHPLLAGHLVALSGEVAALTVRLDLDEALIEDMQPPVERLVQHAAEVSEQFGVEVLVSGIPAIRVEVYRALRLDQFRFLAIGAGIGLLLAHLIFRAIAATILTALAAWIGVLWTLGALGWSGESLNLLNASLPTLVLVVGFADAVHLVAHVRSAKASGASSRGAAESAVRLLGKACLVTSFTTAVGFASLAATRIPLIQRFGISCALGTALALLAVLLVVPLLAGIQRVGAAVAPEAKARDGSSNPRLEAFLDRLCDISLGRPKLVAGLGIATTVLFAWLALGLTPDNGIRESLPRRGETTRALDLVEEHLDGLLSILFVVKWPEGSAVDDPRTLRVLRDLERATERQELFSRPLSALNLLRIFPAREGEPSPDPAAWQLVPEELRRRFAKEQTRRTMLSVRIPANGTRAAQPTFEEMERELVVLREAHPEYEIVMTGTPTVAGRNLNSMISDLARSLGIAGLVIFGAMALAFRSWRLGLAAVLPNAFPLVITAGALAIFDGHLRLPTVITFSICLGIAVDDTTHFLARFRREWIAGRDVHEAIRASVRGAGVPILLTTLVFAGGFGALALSSLPGFQAFGLLAVLAVCTAFVGDLIVLPAILVLGSRHARPRRQPR